MFNSQFNEDEWIVNNLLLPDNGIFVDVGADQPIYGSNSYYFESVMGWDCLCIDADDRVIDKLKAERAKVLHTLVSDYDGDAKFLQEQLPGISHISAEGNITVSTKTLNTILEEADINEITILDIDVEGHELSVCRGLNWAKYKPYIVIIEYVSPAGGNIEKELAAYFSDLQMYTLAHKTSANLIFTRIL